MSETTPDEAFRFYEAVRRRLPGAAFPPAARRAAHLGEVADAVDGFVLDAFGVLNVGDTPIPGAVARMAALRARGKRLCVLTNAASYPRAVALAKYRALGFEFGPDEVVSSRDVAAAALGAWPGATWAALAAEGDDFSDIPARVVDAMAEPRWLEEADGILFLSTARWDEGWQSRLVGALETRARPVVVANPDLVAPREGGLTREPGWYAHGLAEWLALPVEFHGKPFPGAFAEAAARTGCAPGRLAMVGDTLHTDVLGGAAAGMRTVLVADHGLFAGRDVAPYVAASGIVPDWIVPTT